MRQLIVLLVLLVSALTSVSAGDECIRKLLARGGKRFIRVEVWVHAHADHRQIDVLVAPVAALVEGENPPEWDAASSRLLDGDRARALHVFEFNGPPTGRYEVTVVISGGGTHVIQRTSVHTTF